MILNPKEDARAQFEALGEIAVKAKVDSGGFSVTDRLFAREWLLELETERESVERGKRHVATTRSLEASERAATASERSAAAAEASVKMSERAARYSMWATCLAAVTAVASCAKDVPISKLFN